LTRYLESKAPVAPHLFPEDHITDKSQRFFAAELVREKIVRQLGDELPYSTAVEVESFSEHGKGGATYRHIDIG
jgi:GTP-binding protein Era